MPPTARRAVEEGDLQAAEKLTHIHTKLSAQVSRVIVGQSIIGWTTNCRRQEVSFLLLELHDLVAATCLTYSAILVTLKQA
jgi:hypothetical protein